MYGTPQALARKPYLFLTLLALIFWLVSLFSSPAANTISYNDGDTNTSDITLTDSTALLINSGTATQSGILSGGYSVTKTGSGTIVLTGANTYTGSTTIQFGTLTITGSTSSLINSSGDITVGSASGESGALEILNGAQVSSAYGILGNTASSTGSATISGSGTVWSLSSYLIVGKSGTGTLTISDGAVVKSSVKVLVGYQSGSTGSITISNSGVLEAPQIVAGSGTASLTIDGGILRATTTQSAYLSGFTDGTVTIASGGATIDTNGYDISISTALSGSGALIKTSSGTLTLTGANTYSGGTTVDGGSLVLTGSSATIDHGSANLIIGDTTTASVSILDGASVTASSVILGNSATGAGSLTVSNSSLAVGQIVLGSGTGSLTLDTATLSALTNQANFISGFSTVTIGSGGLTVNTDIYSITVSSILDGEGALTKTGDGTLTLTAINTYTGSTTVNGGILRAGTSGAFVNGGVYVVEGGTLDLNGYDLTMSELSGTDSASSAIALGTGTLTLSSNTYSYYEGAITGTGNFTKTGTGSFILYDGASTYTGATIVENGSLTLYDYSLGNTTVTVSSGATFGGNGTLSGLVTVLSGGILSPGVYVSDYSLTEVGVLTVGNLELQSGSTTLMHINSTGTAGTDYDQIVVTGTATLGGTLKLVLGSSYTAKAGDTFTLITASTMSGDFSSVSSILGNALTFSATLTNSTATSSEYVVTVSQGSFVPFATNANQRAVAGAIDRDVSTAGMQKLVDKLNTLPGNSLSAAYQQIAPEELGAMSKMAFQYGHVQIRNVEGRVDAVRSGLTGFSITGLSLYDKNGAVDLKNNSLLAANDASSLGRLGLNKDKLAAPTKNNPWGLFLTGSGQFGNVDGKDDSTGYDLNTAGITLGVDYRLSESGVVGFMLGFQNGQAKMDDGSKLTTNGIKVGPYAGWFEDGWYANAMLNGGYSSYDTKRNVLDETQNGSTNGTEFTGSMGGGYEFKRGNWTFGPTAALEFNYASIDSFSEEGGLAPLSIDSQDATSLVSRFGGRIAYLWKLKRCWIRPEFHLSWQHEFMDTSESITARFVNGTGSSFNVNSTKTAADSAIVGGSIDLSITETFGTYLLVEDEINADYNIGTVFGGLRFNF